MDHQRAKEILKLVFGYDSFRPLQEQCIRAVVEKKDSLLVMPTGGGKSLCYQIPALMFPGLTVVVSPLISLMQDQVSQMKDLGVEAEFLNSTLSWEEYTMNMQSVRTGRTKLLYLAPETLFKDEILMLLGSVRLDCIAIDEAHCISEWGHDFRPEYRRLAEIRSEFPKAVCLALTATATPRVREDIRNNLEINDPQEFIASFNRPNLFYEVLPKSNALVQTLDFLNRFKDQSGIIYCASRRQVDSLTEDLNLKGFSVLPYHAGLLDEERRANQERFIRDDVQIIVATIAFGMGINKPNVRFVIHYDLARNIESYYQETGRAGRDGLPAHCLLLFGYGDIQKMRYWIEQIGDEQEKMIARRHLSAIVHYAEHELCRRTPLLTYFGEEYREPRCGMCDNCVNPRETDFDLTESAQKLMRVMLRTGQRFGAVHLIEILRGSQSQKVLQYNHNRLDVYGSGKEFNLRQWQFILRQLIQKGFLRREEEKFGVLKFTGRSLDVLDGNEQIMGFAPPRAPEVSKREKKKFDVEDYDEELFRLLKMKRKQIADARNVPPYIIFSDKSLVDMSASRPQTREAFANVYGVGEKKLQNYGNTFMKLIKDYCAKGGTTDG